MNGSQITLGVGTLVYGVSISIVMYDNRRKKYYSIEEIQEALKDIRFIASHKQHEQDFDGELIVENYSYEDFDAKMVANRIDFYIDKIQNLNLEK
ncbi:MULTISPECIES: hypothetical protein [Vitreoscilla]|uniref:Uncharacterized protein n=1 Tax=Vitreoscilla stercoraria TaxID=61 RepID=A0ABY4EBB8_VITST|nr:MULTISPECIES: hypothetical protein [Vitreoscilla]AUZ04397.2 hypothetical protein ADP71_06250 [Vitreoscilla sp. C1]UOO91878.1 hypothetical protein LVJ81_09565 [Vitreoscilla stercoraria]